MRKKGNAGEAPESGDGEAWGTCWSWAFTTVAWDHGVNEAVMADMDGP